MMLSYRLGPSTANVVTRKTDGAGVPLDAAEYIAWLAAGNKPDPYVEPPPFFLARDLLELLTDDDLVKIEAATASNVSLRRLWLSLLGQGNAPIRATSERFLAGWAGLTAALREGRADELGGALGIAAPAQSP